MSKDIFEIIIDRLERKLPPELQYHNAEHTQMVIDQARFLAKKESVEGRDAHLIEIACLFHDIGFLDQINDHEKKGCQIASRELTKYDYTKEEIEKVCGMIKATEVPQKPLNLNEMIVADADLFYLGTSSYKTISERLYRELQFLNPGLENEKWFRIQINFLEAHQFHTSYARKNLEPGKQENLRKLKSEYAEIMG